MRRYATNRRSNQGKKKQQAPRALFRFVHTMLGRDEAVVVFLI